MVMLTSVNSFTGIERPILNELEEYWEIVARIDPFRVSFLRKYFYMAKSLSMIRENWRSKYHKALGNYNRSPLAFHQRTKLCNKKLNNIDNDYDLLFQFSSMFIPSANKLTKPYAIYLDRTIKMTEWYFPDKLKSMSPKEQKELHSLVERVFNMADKVFTFNDITRNSVINDYNIDDNKVFTVGSGVNLPVLPDLKKKHTNLVLTVCSDFERHKGQLSIDAFKMAQKKVPEAKFVFVGRNLKETGNRIKSLSWLPHDKLIGLYAQASIVVMPASFGGMQTITEGMANKCVCIANAENPYIIGLVIDKENGFLVSEDDPQEIADLITMILKSRDLRESVGQKAYSHILEKFTWTSTVSKITEHLKELVKQA